MKELSFNVAETFYSIKGEGMHTGTPMYFLRLAGCNVGRRDVMLRDKVRSGAFAEVCTSWDGSKFLCDTDYNSHKKMSVHQVLEDMEKLAGPLIKWVVITGGEPLMPSNLEALHELNDLLGILGKRMHFETNGTYPLPQLNHTAYFACSPKHGWLGETVQACNELRLLVDQNTDPIDFHPIFLKHPCVLLSPVNPSIGFDEASLANCLKILKRHPDWKLNYQLHKVLGID